MKVDNVQLVLFNKKNEVLAVSRKNDHNDFGLIGGSVECYDNDPINAIIRETKEETGITIHEKDLVMIFASHMYGCMGYTYYHTVPLNSETITIYTDEPHVVKWTDFDTVLRGTFGEWNELVAKSLISMGVEFKIHPDD